MVKNKIFILNKSIGSEKVKGEKVPWERSFLRKFLEKYQKRPTKYQKRPTRYEKGHFSESSLRKGRQTKVLSYHVCMCLMCVYLCVYVCGCVCECVCMRVCICVCVFIYRWRQRRSVWIFSRPLLICVCAYVYVCSSTDGDNVGLFGYLVGLF